ncbi:Calx-beta domain-containing protein [Aliikangiella coralliicola]|uniref:Cytochrome c domain-containing protein n=1 Tax=Aliikangiella coralliicola TaxID=2592383 RepID=A0A545U0M6_9GAMM|nr:Calx-beta domain-containing protein [Aliikangiella coralliicola]TQV82963.1 hypothetical protein FLL46_24645 [Aliikangiella coralliicola]
MRAYQKSIPTKTIFGFVSAFACSLFSWHVSADVPAEVQAVFVNNGCLNCHGANNPSGNLSLVDAATSEAQLVDVDATCNGNMKRVVPGDPDNSVLYQKITQANPGCGGVMPPSGNLISVADRNTIFDWIISIGPAAQFGLIELDTTTATAQETDASITLTVNRALGTQGQVSVDYAVATVGTDTATSPDDYVADAGTLVFADGENVKTITVTLADDDIFEGSEVFSVTLSNVVNGAVLGSQVQTKVTIVDNEFAAEPGTFFFSRVDYSVGEGDGTLDVTILRSFGATGEVTVDLNSSDGTAVAGADYNMVSETVTFAEGVKSQVVTVTVLEDQEQEQNETFSLQLSNPTNGALLGSPATVTTTISDNDSEDDGGGDDGGGDDGGGGDTGGGETGGGEPAPTTEAEFEAAGSLFFLIPLMALFVLYRSRK